MCGSAVRGERGGSHVVGELRYCWLWVLERREVWSGVHLNTIQRAGICDVTPGRRFLMSCLSLIKFTCELLLVYSRERQRARLEQFIYLPVFWVDKIILYMKEKL